MIELNVREREALVFIYQYVNRVDNPGHFAPTHQELLDHLNRVLPKRADGKPPLASKQQTLRLAYSLRRKGLLAQGEGVKQISRNMVLTQAGIRAARSYLAA